MIYKIKIMNLNYLLGEIPSDAMFSIFELDSLMTV